MARPHLRREESWPVPDGLCSPTQPEAQVCRAEPPLLARRPQRPRRLAQHAAGHPVPKQKEQTGKALPCCIPRANCPETWAARWPRGEKKRWELAS